MGEITEMMLEGILCMACGVYIETGEAADYPRYCSKACATDHGVDYWEGKEE